MRAPYPLPDARIPLQIGTWGKQLAALAGELADEVKIGGSANPAMIPVMAQRIAVGEARAGRRPGSVKIVIGAVSVIDDDRERARWMARQAVSLYLPIVSRLDTTIDVDPQLMQRMQAHVHAGEQEAAARLVPDDILDVFAFAGDPDDIIAHCQRLYEAGADRVELGTPHGAWDAATGIHLVGPARPARLERSPARLNERDGAKSK